MPQSFVALHYHLIFSTKNRAPLIHQELQPRLFQYIGGILRGQDSDLLAAGGAADHVHLLARLSKELAVSSALRIIKTNSSKWIHESFSELRDFGWQNGYGAFTVSSSQIEQVRRYIANQAEHHREQTFQDEFIELLKKHGVKYEPRYVWD